MLRKLFVKGKKGEDLWGTAGMYGEAERRKDGWRVVGVGVYVFERRG